MDPIRVSDPGAWLDTGDALLVEAADEGGRMVAVGESVGVLDGPAHAVDASAMVASAMAASVAAGRRDGVQNP